MHPPLDRPHPDCSDEIQNLKDCHADGWKKYIGGCNEMKTVLDNCLKAEKSRLLEEMNKNLTEHAVQREDIVKQAFGKSMTFTEFLDKDKDYRKEIEKKQQRA